MKTEELLKSKVFKVFIIFFIVASIINIFKAGYATGQWLYQLLN